MTCKEILETDNKKLRREYFGTSESVRRKYMYLPISALDYNQIIDEALNKAKEELRENENLHFGGTFNFHLNTLVKERYQKSLRESPMLVIEYFIRLNIDKLGPIEFITALVEFLSNNNLTLTSDDVDSLFKNNSDLKRILKRSVSEIEEKYSDLEKEENYVLLKAGLANKKRNSQAKGNEEKSMEKILKKTKPSLPLLKRYPGCSKEELIQIINDNFLEDDIKILYKKYDENLNARDDYSITLAEQRRLTTMLLKIGRIVDKKLNGTTTPKKNKAPKRNGSSQKIKVKTIEDLSNQEKSQSSNEALEPLTPTDEVSESLEIKPETNSDGEKDLNVLPKMSVNERAEQPEQFETLPLKNKENNAEKHESLKMLSLSVVRYVTSSAFATLQNQLPDFSRADLIMAAMILGYVDGKQYTIGAIAKIFSLSEAAIKIRFRQISLALGQRRDMYAFYKNLLDERTQLVAADEDLKGPKKNYVRADMNPLTATTEEKDNNGEK